MDSESALFNAIYEEVKKQDGKLWLRILGQTHWQFDELPFWVLLKDRGQIKEALQFLQKALRPLQDIPSADITVSFITFENKLDCGHGYFKGEKFFRPNAINEIYEDPECLPRKCGVFDHEYPDDSWSIRDRSQA